jgi:hypothetical protein
MFRHPKYYKELRKRNKSDQAISSPDTREVVDSVRSDPGLKLPGPRPISNANKGLIHKRQASSVKLSNQPVQASSDKHQAPSSKLQAPSHKQQAPRS